MKRLGVMLIAASLVAAGGLLSACSDDDNGGNDNQNQNNQNNNQNQNNNNNNGNCGNGVVDEGEECDGTDWNGQTCESLGFAGGSLACDSSCRFDTSGCTTCGNGVREGDEQCDGTDLGGTDCQDLGYDAGDLACKDDCTFDVDGCATGLAGFGEPCRTDDDCAAGMCFDEVDGGWPSGMCVDRCQQDGTCADPSAVCLWDIGYDLCLPGCDANTPCRDGYVCNADLGICLPGCTDDAQCTITGDCDTDPDSDTSGMCIHPDEDCGNGIDDDFDDLADCSDPDCNDATDLCPSGEICDNGSDDDGDSLVDCDDGECKGHVNCTGVACTPANALSCGQVLTDVDSAGTGSTNAISQWCGGDTGWTGSEIAYTLTVDATRDVRVALTNLQADLDLFILYEDQRTGPCNPMACLDGSATVGATAPEEVTFTAEPGKTYYIVIDGWDGAASTFDLTIGCENCTNSQDDDGNGLADCDDPMCTFHEACLVCTASAELTCGQTLTNQSATTNEYNGYCRPSSVQSGFHTGPELIYHFVTDTTQQVRVTVHIDDANTDLDLFVLGTNSGGACSPLNCIDRSLGSTQDEEVTFDATANEDFYFVVDGYNGAQGTFSISVECQ